MLREEIRMAIEKEQLISRQEQEKLQLTITELRDTIQRREGQFSRKEEVLRQDMNDLRQVIYLFISMIEIFENFRDFKKLKQEMKI